MDKGQETTTIGIYSKQPVLAKALAKQKLPALKLKQVDSVKEAQKQLQAEKLDNYLVVTKKMASCSARSMVKRSPMMPRWLISSRR